MADDTVTVTVTVTALKFHTLHGEAHAEGSTYDVDEKDLGNLVAQGLVSAPPAAPAPAKASQPVEPMTTDDLSPKKAKR